MANMCSNAVAFQGKPETIKKIQKLFERMAEKEIEQQLGQLPDFTTIYTGYFFDIYWNEDGAGEFQYQTRWSPNLEILEQIADHYKVNFVVNYEESGNLVYGRAIYESGELTDIYLESEDFDTYKFDEDTDTYHFEGETYESDCEILETLLERRIDRHK